MSIGEVNKANLRDTDRGDDVAERLAVLIILSLILLKGDIILNSF